MRNDSRRCAGAPGWVSSTLAEATAYFNEATAEVERLREENYRLVVNNNVMEMVVRRLPTNGDGDPALMGDNCYAFDTSQPDRPLVGCGIVQLSEPEGPDGAVPCVVRTEDGVEFSTYVDETWVRKETAEAAREKNQ